MKKLFILFFILLTAAPLFSQNSKWSDLSYTYSKGPVSPQFQYSYTILVDRLGNATFNYVKSDVPREFPFTVGKKGMRALNNCLKKSKVFSVSPQEMEADSNLMGGSSRTMVITMYQSPLLDAMPESIQVPAHINDTYFERIDDLYSEIENLVPSEIWEQALAN
ncbi:MAG: hypothetical protein ABI528_06435 [bacterium]